MSAMPAPVLKWDSEAWRAMRNANLKAWMLGNVDAVDTVIGLSTIAETWDDLADGDVKPTVERVNEAFTLALITLQGNVFYKANEALFYSQIVTSVNAWMDANELQGSRVKHERMMAFFLRNIGQEIAQLAAFRVGGWEHMRKVSIEMRRFFFHETFDSWSDRHA